MKFSVSKPVVKKILDSQAVDRCLSMVRLALTNRERDKAVAAIDRLFVEERAVEIQHNSPLAVLGLPPRVVGILERGGILNVGSLAGLTREELLEVRQIGPRQVSEIVAALATAGLSLKNSG